MESYQPFPRPVQGSWLESIALFEAIREGNQPVALRLLETSSDKEVVLGGLLSIFDLLLRCEQPEKLDHFVAISQQIGPPPAYGSRPYIPRFHS